MSALDILDEINASGGIAYDDYSRLHDAIAALSPTVEPRQITRDEVDTILTDIDTLNQRSPSGEPTEQALNCALRIVAETTAEVEWGVRQDRDGEVFEFTRERHARDYAKDVTTVTHHGGNMTEHSRTLVRRTVGPWIEVQS